LTHWGISNDPTLKRKTTIGVHLWQNSLRFLTRDSLVRLTNCFPVRNEIVVDLLWIQRRRNSSSPAWCHGLHVDNVIPCTTPLQQNSSLYHISRHFDKQLQYLVQGLYVEWNNRTTTIERRWMIGENPGPLFFLNRN